MDAYFGLVDPLRKDLNARIRGIFTFSVNEVSPLVEEQLTFGPISPVKYKLYQLVEV